MDFIKRCPNKYDAKCRRCGTPVSAWDGWYGYPAFSYWDKKTTNPSTFSEYRRLDGVMGTWCNKCITYLEEKYPARWRR